MGALCRESYLNFVLSGHRSPHSSVVFTGSPCSTVVVTDASVTRMYTMIPAVKPVLCPQVRQPIDCSGAWANLPGDLIYRVLTVYKNATASRMVTPLCKTLSQINKHWCFTLNHAVTRLHLRIGVKGTDVERLLNRFQHLEKIKFQSCTDESLFPIGRYPYTYVKVLDLQGCQDITDAGLLSLQSLTSLTHLDLTDCVQISDDGLMVLTNLLSLKFLSLRLCWPHPNPVETLPPLTEFTQVGFKAVGQVTSLMELSLKGRREVGDLMLMELSSLTSLTCLKLSSTNITNEGLHGISSLRSLVCLRIACENITDEGFTSLLDLTALTCLRISSCLRMTDKGMSAVARITSLSKLLIGHAPLLTDQGIGHLTALTNLRSLVLGYCGSVTTEGLKPLSSLQSLARLGFKSCPRVVRKDLIGLRTEIPWLLKLRVFCV